MKALFAVLACAFCVAANAAPPAAPVVTVSATDVRQLEFNWEPVSGVQWYELWFRSSDLAAWVKYAERDARLAPLFRIGVPVHLLDWPVANYAVKACNSGGCRTSNLLYVNGEQLAAMGYIKPKAPTGHRLFGHHLAASADGRTVAVLTGETMGSAQDSVAVHVYRKTTSSSGWRREARLLPTQVQTRSIMPGAGLPIALSGDGNVLALGSTFESRLGGTRTGAVYVFRRTGDTWALSQTITAAPQDEDLFGYVVKLDDAGRTLVVSHRSVGDRYYGIVEVYRDAAGGAAQFVHNVTVPAPPGDAYAPSCFSVALSGDGSTLARACDHFGMVTNYIYNGPSFTLDSTISGGAADGLDLTYDGSRILIRHHGGGELYRRAPGNWVLEAFLSNGEQKARGGVAISRDGNFAVLGNWLETAIGLGPLYPPYVQGDETTSSGGVYVYQRKASGWALRRLVKPGSNHRQWAGHSLALGDNGRLLVVGAQEDPSGATGIDGNRNDASAPSRGAVWLY